MFGQKSQPSPRLVQSQWWERLASFAAEQQNSQSSQSEGIEPSAEAWPADNWKQINRKRGFRLNVRRPLFSSLRLNTR